MCRWKKEESSKIMATKVQAENWWKSCNFPCMQQIGHFLVLLFSETSNVFVTNIIYRGFLQSPTRKNERKRKSEPRSVFFFFPVAATVTGGSLLNAGNRLVCFSLSDCHTTLFVIPFWTVAYRIKARMKVCRLVKTRDVLNHIPYAHTHTQSSVTKDSSTLMMKQCACACK